MREAFQNTYTENGYLIQNYEDFQTVLRLDHGTWSSEGDKVCVQPIKFEDCTWSSENEEPYVQLPMYMFFNVQGFDSITIPSYILYNDIYYQVYLPDDCSELFWRCTAENIDLHYVINTSNVMNMREIFACCSGLTSLELSNFDTSNVSSMEGMFCYCAGLTSLELSSFDTSNVSSMEAMFGYCIDLTSLDISNFDTLNVTNMCNMFNTCKSLTELDLSNFDTSNVIDMFGMFCDCVNLTSLDISNFNTSNVTGMHNMFEECPAGDIYKDDKRFITAF